MGKEREQVKRKFKALEKSRPDIADSIFSARPYSSYSMPITEDQQEHNEFLDDWVPSCDINEDVFITNLNKNNQNEKIFKKLRSGEKIWGDTQLNKEGYNQRM